VRPREEAYLETGERFTVRANGIELACWRWGTGPVVVLTHGWGSRAGRWSSLVPLLLEAGLSSVAFDAPAHGRSTGNSASMPEFARALLAVREHLGEAPRSAVGHSLGGAATALALSMGFDAERVVLIAAPSNAQEFTDRFAETLGLPDSVRSRMERNLEARLKFTFADLHIPTLAAHLGTPALLVHDTGDRDVPFAGAEEVAAAWPGARLMATTGLGHRKVLHDPAVLQETRDFILAGA
jgi:pimeloyl-ACP methyl ester carboxylesterase